MVNKGPQPAVVIESTSEAFVAYLPDIQAAVSTTNQPTPTPSVKDSLNTRTTKFMPWGENNLFPQDVIKDAYSNTIIPTVLDFKARALYSKGLVYGYETENDKGEITFTQKKLPEVEEFFRRTNIKRFIREACQDYYWWNNLFVEMILDGDKKKVAQIAVQDASFCRFGLQDTKTGDINKCFISANWDIDPEGTKATDLPVVDPYYNSVEKARKLGTRFIYPINSPTPGQIYYQTAPWNTIRSSGWLDVAKAIPKFKAKLLKQQLTIKYHIQIADYWWDWKYPNFKTKKQEDKDAIIKAELDSINKILQGYENAGKSIITAFKSDPISGKQYPGWIITAIDDKLKDGLYIEDSQEASSHIFTALGVDPTIFGISPGKGMGAGSGSDKRVAHNIYTVNAKPEADTILECLDFVRDFNGWDNKLVFWFRNYLIATLDQGSEVKQQN